jgi:hypothetical protein
MRSGFSIDPSPGWAAILEGVHRLRPSDAEALVIFSVVGLMLLVTLSALPWFRRPEAWVGALLTAAVFVPSCTTRLARGRPYLVTTAALMTLLFLWSRQSEDRPRRLALILTPVLVAASAWIHGSWYMLALPGAAILFSGWWRSALWYWGCWLGGSFLGSAFTGHPWEFLMQAVKHMSGVFGDFALNRQLEPEFFPSDGEIGAVLLAAAVLVWRKLSLGWNPRIVLNPVFMMMALGWLLGLKMRRFWWDWGTPAFMVWVALELQDQLERHVSLESARRLFITLALAAGVFFGFTSDRESRWTGNLTREYLAPDNPNAAGWLPEAGGILYNGEMDVFFDTFFKNPTGNWRYVLGFEPGLMDPEDLAVLRRIQWNYGDSRAYEPWAKRMRPEDRMVIRGVSGAPPRIRELEWHYAASQLWVGRLPRPAPDAPATSPPEGPGTP